jgi:hypothetical protein
MERGADKASSVNMLSRKARRWERGGKRIAFQASGSGIYNEFTLARSDPGAPTRDSDIYVMNVDDWMPTSRNATPSTWTDNPTCFPSFCRTSPSHRVPIPSSMRIHWSPDRTIVFTRHDGEVGTYQDPDAVHNNTYAEVYVIRKNAMTPLRWNGEPRRGHRTAG